MEIGIVGLPLSGKTTLFSTLTGQDVEISHIGGKFEARRGTVKVPDSRLDELNEIFKPQKLVNATIEYIEVGGLEKDTARTKGFDPQFLAILKNTDTLCLVTRAFEDEFHPHPEGSVDPKRDLHTIETEFMLSDLSIVENRISRLSKQIQQSKTEEDIREKALMQRFLETLENETPLRAQDLSPNEKVKIRGFQFLSAKPLLIVVNYAEDDIANEGSILSKFSEYETKSYFAVTGLSAKVELEISQLDSADKKLFLNEMRISQPATEKIIHKSYELLGLISFFTYVENECRAWTIPAGSSVQKAAGAIHTDMERGFIKAEVVSFSDFIKCGSIAKCRENGVLKLEGKDYVVQDGDIVTIRFSP
jgi:GTP-binding protein YchF